MFITNFPVTGILPQIFPGMGLPAVNPGQIEKPCNFN
jgi:hypothetical protein